MSIDWQYDLMRFTRLLCPEQVGNTPRLLDDRTLELRLRLIDEEYQELRSALVNGDMAGAVDGMADTIYVILGTAVAMGVDLGPVWDAVHAANLKKASGPRREDGKILKPPGWEPPDIATILAAQKPLREDTNG